MSNPTHNDPAPEAGLPMSPMWDPEKLAAERAELAELAKAPLGKRSAVTFAVPARD